MKKKILLITYYWPPDGGAGVQRWLKFVKYLSKDKYDITVYTPSNAESPNHDKSLLRDVPSEIELITKPIWEPFTYYKKLTKQKGQFNAGFLNEESSGEKSFIEKLSLFIRANLFIPDAKMFWIRPSVKYLRKYITQNKIDLIISSGPPHSLHMIGRKLQKKNRIKWIADFRDPWTNIDFYKELPTLHITDSLHKKKEKRVLQSADQVIVVGEQMKKEFLVIHPNANISVISNGFDLKINDAENKDDLFTIVHVGSINADRSHESFYLAIRSIIDETPLFKNKILIKYIGKVDSKTRNYIKKFNLEDVCLFIPYLPYDQINLIQNRAHVLYLPLNDSLNAKGILTGKFFEYLTANRVILAQGPPDGDLAKILKETKSGVIFQFDEVIKLKNFIHNMIEDYLNNNYQYMGRNISKYSRKKLTAILEKIIDQTLSQ